MVLFDLYIPHLGVSVIVLFELRQTAINELGVIQLNTFCGCLCYTNFDKSFIKHTGHLSRYFEGLFLMKLPSSN